jgi:hypothetical protein
MLERRPVEYQPEWDLKAHIEGLSKDQANKLVDSLAEDAISIPS